MQWQHTIKDIDIKTDPRFSILNIADLLNIRITGQKGVEKIARCPFCGDSENHNSGHLYLNTATNQYYCVRCSKGGYAVGLYADLLGIKKGEAIYEIAKENRITYSPQPLFCKENSIAPIEQRDKVYNALLKLLTLDSSHIENLIQRGLSLQDITEKSYRSIPTKESAVCITKKLISTGISLNGIPGFYKDENHNWTFVTYQGFFIPVRNVKNQIQGLQVRLDKVEKGNKYRWFSSRHLDEGTRAKSWAHIAKGKKGLLVITEGPLKADVASFLSDMTFIGVPGVNAINGIEETIFSLPVELRKHIHVAYDMDLRENKQVSKARKKLVNVLKKHFPKSKIQTLEWPKDAGNAVDDLLLNKKKGKVKPSIMTMWKMRHCLALLQ